MRNLLNNRKTAVLILLWMHTFVAYSQVPQISYTTPNQLYAGQAIVPLEPINSGGIVNYDVVVSTLAGSGIQGSVNDNGALASFRYPTYVALDHLGNVIVVDRSNHLIRKIMPNGDVTTLAGTGAIGTQNGNALLASFKFPDAAVTDSNGNIFITDQSNHTIRKITPEGIVSTFAGTGSVGSDDGDGTTAAFYYPAGIAVDADDNLLIADFGNNKVRKITPDGSVSTFAGTGVAGAADGTALLATFSGLTGVALDSQNNVYVADYYNNTVRKIDVLGMVTTFAGSGVAGSDDGLGTQASFFQPATISMDVDDNLFLTDEGNSKIRKITPNGTVTTYAGSGIVGADEGTAFSATFAHPTGLVVNGTVVYVSDYENHKIRKIDRYGYTISPALPEGLVLNEATGSISGTPTATLPATDFSVTAINSFGSDSFVVNIAVAALNADEFALNSISIAPNPVWDFLSITCEHPVISLKIYTFLGQEILHVAPSSSVIDVSGLPKGVYVMDVRTESAQQHSRLIKE